MTAPATGTPTTPTLVEREHADGVEHLRLSDGARSNPLGPVLVGQLRAALADSGTTARAVLITAAGRNFCSGGDHEAFMAGTPDERRAYLADIRSLLAELRACPIPTVASVRGAAIGGGTELALSCDLVVAAASARFHLPQVAVESRADQRALEVLVARTDIGFARRMLLLGEPVDGTAASAAGMVDVVTDDDPDPAAQRLTQVLAQQPPKAMAKARRALLEASGTGRDPCDPDERHRGRTT